MAPLPSESDVFQQLLDIFRGEAVDAVAELAGHVDGLVQSPSAAMWFLDLPASSCQCNCEHR